MTADAGEVSVRLKARVAGTVYLLVFLAEELPCSLAMFGGLSWLTFLSQPLAGYLRPYNIAPGVLGEGSLTLWLLLASINARK